MVKPFNWKMIAGFGAAALVVGGLLLWVTHRAPAPRYVTAPVTRGDVATTITASGSVNPVVTVEVGTYVRARSRRSAATTTPASIRVSCAPRSTQRPTRSSWIRTRPTWRRAKAQLVKDQANVVYTKLASDRAALLFKENSGSRDAADAALDAYNQAAALVGLDAAAIAQKAARAEGRADQPELHQHRLAGGRHRGDAQCHRRPDRGREPSDPDAVPDRHRSDQDAGRHQCQRVRHRRRDEGAGASFTVDAFPNQTFQGTVVQVRQSPISVQNVITYDVVIAVANPDLLLKPGMTATARIVKAQAATCCEFPSQALRFTPAGAAKPRPPGAAGQRAVWVDRDGKLVQVPVTVGLDDETNAEIKSGDLKLGDQVVTSEARRGQGRQAHAAATPSLQPVGGARHGRSGRQARRHHPVLPAGRHRGACAAGGQRHDRARRVRRHHGIVRLGQVDPDEHHRLPRPADQRPIPVRGARRRAAVGERTGRHPRPADRLRVPELQSAGPHQRAGERRPAAALRRRRGADLEGSATIAAARGWPASAWPIASATRPASSPAGSSSASPWRAR